MDINTSCFSKAPLCISITASKNIQKDGLKGSWKDFCALRVTMKLQDSMSNVNTFKEEIT